MVPLHRHQGITDALMLSIAQQQEQHHTHSAAEGPCIQDFHGDLTSPDCTCPEQGDAVLVFMVLQMAETKQQLQAMCHSRNDEAWGIAAGGGAQLTQTTMLAGKSSMS